jgi:AcrR family transcriptional regulator
MPAKRKAVKRRRVATTRPLAAPALSRTRAIVDAAERLFVRDGFQATTIAAIAAEAGVSAETIYKTFGGKTGLVRAIRERDWPETGRFARGAAVERAAAGGARPASHHRRLGTVDDRSGAEGDADPAAGRGGGAGGSAMARLREELDLARLKRMAGTRHGSPAPATCAMACALVMRPTCCGHAVRPNCTSCSSRRRGWTAAPYARSSWT